MTLQLLIQMLEAFRGYEYFGVQLAVFIVIPDELLFVTPFLFRVAYCCIFPEQIILHKYRID